jgi:hypothetical protein
MYVTDLPVVKLVILDFYPFQDNYKVFAGRVQAGIREYRGLVEPGLLGSMFKLQINQDDLQTISVNDEFRDVGYSYRVTEPLLKANNPGFEPFWECMIKRTKDQRP